MRKLVTWLRRSFARTDWDRELDPPLFLPVKFRPYEKRDYPALMDIFRIVSPGRFPEGEDTRFGTFLDETENGILVGELGGKAISCAGLVQMGPGIFNFCYSLIHPSYHGKRIGSTMTLLRVVAAGAASKPGTLHYALIFALPDSLSFYRRFGFKDYGTWTTPDGQEFPAAVSSFYTETAKNIYDIYRWRNLRVKEGFKPAISKNAVVRLAKDSLGKNCVVFEPIEQTEGGTASEAAV